MSKLPLVEGILKYIKQDNSMFCMPGHKAGKGFINTNIGTELYENFIKCDITEVDGMDNLHHPTGIIKDAQNLLSKYYGSKKSYFLVNGSSSGNLAMMFSSFKEGDKIIVERNCHRSISNGIIMRKLNPVYIKNKLHKGFNAPLSIDEAYFIDLLNNNEDAKGIVITYPNYYGICCDLGAIIDEAHKRGMLVLVDSAHGAHFGVHQLLPESAVKLGADMVVMSAHKTLPSLTQTAYLHVGNGIDTEKVDFYVSSFLSTSPSYMLMSSMDYGRYFLEYIGQEAYEKFINVCNLYRNKINKIEGFHILDIEDVEVYDIDITRYVLNVSQGYSGYKLYDYLIKNTLQPELCDGSNVVLIFSPFNEEEEFENLYKVLKGCNLIELKDEKIEIIEVNIPSRKLLPFEALESNKTEVSYKEAAGSICGESIVPYPPGIPIVLPGEIIGVDTINYIKHYLDKNSTIMGVYENETIKILADKQ